MDSNKILNSDYLDILFEGRNKNYGAYELRKNHSKRMFRAMLVILGIGMSAAAMAIVAELKPDKPRREAVTNEIDLADIPPRDPDITPPPPPPPPPVKPTVKFTPPVIDKDEEVAEEEIPPEQNELKDVSAGLEDIVGDPNALDPGIVDPGPTTAVVEQKVPEIRRVVEQMPDPGYNVNAYLAKNINYPQTAIESGVSGRVAIQFVVYEDGSISGVQVAGNRKLGAGLEEEAMRVVRAMPKWQPGKQNGRAVKVYYTLPVSFKLE